MASNIGPRGMGEFPNFNFEDGTVSGWSGTRSIFEGDSSDGLGANKYCMETTGRWSTSAWNSGQRRDSGDSNIPVDTSETWTLSYRVRGYQNATDGTPPWHYLGFTGFDKNKRFVDLRNCGGVGNTYLSRDLNVGDSYAYIQSNSGWYTGGPYYFRNLCLYPATHPDYSTPHTYTRIGYGDYNLYYSGSPVLQPEGDYRLTLANSGLNAITYNYSAYPTPAGTPVMNGRAGGTYNYTFSRRQYTVSAGWQTMQSTFTGESRNSGQPFRYAVKYIRSMILHNYALGTDSQNSLCHWDRMLFIKNNNNRYNLD